ncbi:RCC1 domain-containing protein [Candidatus Palauibacter sp.]|uniref:RCC1 domain-containing protein n=1 Tax=Candidatus Palauibacter sp. TaxID=3101350 RepID=UPI003B51B988
MGATRTAPDGFRSLADVQAVRRGRHTVIARHPAAEPGRGTAVVWEWASAVVREPAVWTRRGESRCAEIGAEGVGGETLVLSGFDDMYARSLDPETVTVDSVAFSDDGEAVRVCMTGRRHGTGRIALTGWDTAGMRYVGSYEPHHVLAEPLAFSIPHERWEIGRGQREQLQGRLVDGRGLEVQLPAGEVRSWTTGDGSVFEVDATAGVMTGVASGSAQLSATFLGQTARSRVEVYEIVDGRAGWGVICVLTKRGTIRCWGEGDNAWLGYGITTQGTLEGPDVGDVPLGGVATGIARHGGQFVCALLDAGDVRCWGLQDYGQLGYGSRVSQPVGDDETPADLGSVPVGGTVTGIAGGDSRACALMDTGSLRCWGNNSAGQLGYGSTAGELAAVGDDETPADLGDVPLGGRALQAIGGRLWTCALMDTGRVRCWGINSAVWNPETGATGPTFGLGYGPDHGFASPIGDDETPADVGDLPLPGRAVKLAGAGYHACALMEDGSVLCWGTNLFGQLGHGLGSSHHIGDDETAAFAVPLDFPSPVADIVAGYFHSCVLLENGEVYCWGLNESGALGYGDNRPLGEDRLGDDEDVLSAGPVPLAGPATGLFAGDLSTCAVLRSGPLTCWGSYRDLAFNATTWGTVGDDETPVDVGPVKVFPGPLPLDRIGEVRTHPSPAVVSAGESRWPPVAYRATQDIDATSLDPGPALPGPLDGVDGVIPPDSAGASPRWIRVAAEGN